jgi:hypothetical protein
MMAGKGPPPKEAGRRARANKDPVPLRVITAEPVKQPALPVIYFADDEGKRRRFVWPERTKVWWKMWRDSPLSAEFTATDWSELLDTALLHARYWSGALSLAGELRLRVAKFGATPEDRARLRIQFAQADEAEEKREQQPSSRRRRGAFTGDARRASGD